MSHIGGLALYVTSHGFGHLNRSVAVINRIPSEIPVTIRSDPSLFNHWGERLKRPARLEPHASDVGALNPPGDSARTDGPGTLAKAAEVHARAMTLIHEETSKLRDERTAAILSDATPVPLVAAKKAGIPGYLLANFTWADIYRPHAKKLGPDAGQTVREIRSAYRHASTLFRAEPALKMAWMPDIVEVGMVVTPGLDRRVELRSKLGIPTSDKLVYFYIGRYGQANLGWERLAQLEGVHFVGFHPSPTGPMANLHVIDPTEWTGADLAASADAIVAKAGYGTACEAMAARVPFIYPPRTGFAEHRVLDRALRAWGGGIPATSRDFAALKLEKHLEKAFQRRPGPPPFQIDGAAKVAGHLIEAWKRGN
jgi:UDP:flavonoid glycosyltransferase YjiC (YdhE family)